MRTLLAALFLLAGCAGPASTARPVALPDFAATTQQRTTAPITAAAVLASLPIKGKAPMTGYSRARFGPAWADTDGNGCDQRDDVLARDLRSVVRVPGRCWVASGTLHDPYTGASIAFHRGVGTSRAVQIDHVWPLGAAWVQGAQPWSDTRRQAFANDLLNLLAVDGPTNERKGDKLADAWLPPDRGYRCMYVARQVAVGAKYRLWVTRPERDAMARVLGACPDQRLPEATERSAV